MASWGHRLREATEREIEFRRDMGWACSTTSCGEPVTHFTVYQFTTGRSGRVGTRETGVCAQHAEKFAAKHGLSPTGRPATP